MEDGQGKRRFPNVNGAQRASRHWLWVDTKEDAHHCRGSSGSSLCAGLLKTALPFVSSSSVLDDEGIIKSCKEMLKKQPTKTKQKNGKRDNMNVKNIILQEFSYQREG